MGAAVAKEVNALWYAIRHFVFETGSRCRLPQFLREDISGIGVHPGELVQHLRYHVEGDDGFDCRPKWAGKAFGHLNRIQKKDVDLVVVLIRMRRVRSALGLWLRLRLLARWGSVVWKLRAEGFGAVSVRRSNPWEDVSGLFDGEVGWQGRLVSFGLNEEWEKGC
jgi:hypothetical protein